MLEDHLAFIERFYASAAEPFETIKRKIERREMPFVPRHEPGDYDGYEYQHEFNEASACLRILGYCSHSLAVKALHDYLRQFIMRERSVVKAEELGPILKCFKGRGWFEKYIHFLEQRTRFNWVDSPVTRDRIEQINLSRNDVIHDPDIESTWPTQSEDHFRKYPVSRFAEDWELAMVTPNGGNPEFPLRLNVTRDRLAEAISDIRSFCAFVEKQRTQW